jgi:glycosyltransferase involved in cell wall biosynthesis
MQASKSLVSAETVPTQGPNPWLQGKRVGMVLFSTYPSDPRPRRAIAALLKEGMSIDLICLEEEKAPQREVEGSLDVRRIPLRHTRGGPLSYAYRYSAFIVACGAVLGWRSLRKRYDLVYVHNMPDILVLSALVPKALGAKVILDLHDPMPELMLTIFNLREGSTSVRVIRWLEKWSMAFADQIITVNIACKRIFAARSCAAEKIGIVMNSPDEEIFPMQAPLPRALAESRNPKSFVIMYHGSLVERNGLDLAVDALARVRKNIPTAELRIFGRKTPFLDHVMNQVQELGLTDCVQYLGPRSLEGLVHEIENCDVGVIPNQRNAFTDINTPTRIFEYLALGRPVIAPSTPGIQDYFTNESLYFFESGNAQELADQIERVALNESEALETAKKGQRLYQSHAWHQERKTLVDIVAGVFKPVRNSSRAAAE